MSRDCKYWAEQWTDRIVSMCKPYETEDAVVGMCIHPKKHGKLCTEYETCVLAEDMSPPLLALMEEE